MTGPLTAITAKLFPVGESICCVSVSVSAKARKRQLKDVRVLLDGTDRSTEEKLRLMNSKYQQQVSCFLSTECSPCQSVLLRIAAGGSILLKLTKFCVALNVSVTLVVQWLMNGKTSYIRLVLFAHLLSDTEGKERTAVSL